MALFQATQFKYFILSPQVINAFWTAIWSAGSPETFFSKSDLDLILICINEYRPRLLGKW